MVEVPTSLSTSEAFAHIHLQAPFSFFLDSGMDPHNLGRFSFLGSDPFLIMSSHGSEVTLCSHGKKELVKANPFDVLGDILRTYTLSPIPNSPSPLLGGAVGYFSYDLCHFIEQLPSTNVDDLHIPECFFAFYDCILTFDHLENRVFLASTGFPEQQEHKRLARARERIEEMRERLLTSLTSLRHRIPDHQFNSDVLEQSTSSIKPRFTREEYMAAVQKIRDYIAAGDVFQVNLSNRFETSLPSPPYELYQLLRQINPAPFGAYLNFDGLTILSASPERFLRVQGNLVETRPMKGTRPRGQSPQEDLVLADELMNSPKDMSENVMIVDLERNDLGRVCSYGSVRVRELLTLEKYATVFQLTSTVQGELELDKSRLDLIKACFPGGSITGAPKVRAMEIIDELEPTKRSVYTGSIGYLSYSGEMDLNIAIRTLLIKDKRAYFQVGGGIVYDSDPAKEYQETLDKAKALFQALTLASATQDRPTGLS